MDLEPLFFRLHSRLLSSYTRLLSHKYRKLVERVVLFQGVCLLALLFVLHIRFVVEPGCATILSKHNPADVDVYQIQIQALWLKMKRSIRKELELVHTLQSQISPYDVPLDSHDKSVLEGKDDNSLRDQADWLNDPLYIYSREKGFLELDQNIRRSHDILTANLTLTSHDECLGGPFLQALIEIFVGYDTIILNAFTQHMKGVGYVLNLHMYEFFDLSHRYSTTTYEGPADFVVQKIGIVITSLFLFFTASTLVSLCLREAQFRVFQFTFQLQYFTRHRLPCGRLIMSHIVKSLVFVLVLIGILFFFAEFLEDQVLALMLLTNCWVCELFSIICVRTESSVRFFPRFFLLYFLLFHIYYFSFPFGFTYLAFITMGVFVQHSVLYFANHHEIPALHYGLITQDTPRFPFTESQNPSQQGQEHERSQSLNQNQNQNLNQNLSQELSHNSQQNPSPLSFEDTRSFGERVHGSQIPNMW